MSTICLNRCTVAHLTRLRVRSRKAPERGLVCQSCSAVGTYEKEIR